MQNESPKGPIAWMIHNRVAANLLMVFFLAGGLFTFTKIRQEVFPDIAENRVTVSVAYPGSSPEEVEQGIVLAIEEALTGLEGIEHTDSVASEGSGRIVATLLEDADPMKVYQDIKSEVDRITTLPLDSERPVVALDVHRRETISLVLYGDATESSLRELAEQARSTLLQAPEITQVDLAGVRPLEIRIEIPQNKLRRYGLTLQQVADQLAAASVDLPGGGIKTEKGEILLRVKERRDYARQFARLPVITGPDGSQVLLGDLATVLDDFEETDRFALYNGKPAVMLEVYRVGDQTPIEVVDAVLRQMEEIGRFLPASIQQNVLNDRADIYRQRARLLLRNGAIGLVLVMILLGGFLELRLAFWVMMGIPVSFLGSLLIMPAVDLSINMVTMFAYIVALGIVVDDAIVVGENIYHQHQNGMPFMKAAILGTKQVAVPVGFSILTNIVAFVPLFLLPGIMGRVLRMLPVVVISTFLISWVECLFILPSHLAHHKDREKRGFFGWFHNKQQRFSHGFLRWTRTKYGPFLDFALHHRYAVVMLAIGILTLTLGYVISGRMGFQMFPKVESDYAYAYAELPYGAPIAKTEAISRQMYEAAQAVIKKAGHPELVQGIFSDIGKSGSHTVEMRVFLAPPEIRNDIMGTQEFVNQWRQRIGQPAGVKTINLQADRGGPGSGAALTIQLSHRRVSTLEKACVKLASELTKFPRVKDIDDGFQLGKEQLDFNIRPQGERLGLTAAGVARQVRNAYQGAEVVRQQRGRNEVKVRVYLPKSERISEYNLDEMILRTPAGGEVPLHDVVTVNRGRAYTSISRRDGERTMTVTADVTPRSQTGLVINALDTEIFPALMSQFTGLTYSYEGHQAEDRKSMGSMKAMIPIVLISIYALLAIPFRSYIQPLIVMISIPFGIVGAVAGHLIMGYKLSMIGVIGILALSGVVVNDALVLIDFANNKRKEHDTAHDAVLAAGVQRFRPILLTTLTTFGGLAPMIFETSRQARFLIPMALSLGYGLLFATMITLVLVPSLYMIVEDIRNLGSKS
jgi:multidrug efflux pump subunit AcrB